MFALVVAVLLSAAPDPNPDDVAITARYMMILNPTVSERQALRLSKIVRYHSTQYNVDPDLMVAIIRKESNFLPGSIACWPAPWKGDGEYTCDYGLAQINQTWVEKWGLDPVKLVIDDWYNIATQARVLAWLRKHYGDEADWFGRYHSATPSKRSKYVKAIGLYLAQREIDTILGGEETSKCAFPFGCWIPWLTSTPLATQTRYR